MSLITFSSIPNTHTVLRLVFPGDWIHIQPSQLENPKYFLVSMYCFKPALEVEQSQISLFYFMLHSKCLDYTSIRAPQRQALHNQSTHFVSS